MSHRIRVDCLTQPTSWTCFHTCLVMLDRYRSSRAGGFHHPSDLESMLYPDSRKTEIDERMNAYLLGKGPTLSQMDKYLIQKKYQQSKSFLFPGLAGLLTPEEARKLAKSMGFTYSTINVNPNSFERILDLHGPFIWVGNLRHTVLVTILDLRKDLYFVSYNDPNGGRRDEKEFYEFLMKLMPSMMTLGQKMIEVFHIKR